MNVFHWLSLCIPSTIVSMESPLQTLHNPNSYRNTTINTTKIDRWLTTTLPGRVKKDTEPDNSDYKLFIFLLQFSQKANLY